jgi:hypothetical protein
MYISALRDDEPDDEPQRLGDVITTRTWIETLERSRFLAEHIERGRHPGLCHGLSAATAVLTHEAEAMKLIS